MKLFLRALEEETIRLSNRANDFFQDYRYRTHTTNNKELSELTIESENRWYGRRYQGTPYRTLKNTFQSLNRHPAVDHKNGIFVDLGAGRGRAMMLAAEHGFHNVVGVEFSKELCRSCQKNLRSYEEHQKGPSAKFDIFFGDAVLFPIPEDAQVFFLYNPFSEEVIDRVLDRVEATKFSHSDIFFLYVNPIRGKLFRARGYDSIYRVVSRNPNYVVHFYRKKVK